MVAQLDHRVEHQIDAIDLGSELTIGFEVIGRQQDHHVALLTQLGNQLLGGLDGVEQRQRSLGIGLLEEVRGDRVDGQTEDTDLDSRRFDDGGGGEDRLLVIGIDQVCRQQRELGLLLEFEQRR